MIYLSFHILMSPRMGMGMDMDMDLDLSSTSKELLCDTVRYVLLRDGSNSLGFIPGVQHDTLSDPPVPTSSSSSSSSPLLLPLLSSPPSPFLSLPLYRTDCTRIIPYHTSYRVIPLLTFFPSSSPTPPPFSQHSHGNKSPPYSTSIQDTGYKSTLPEDWTEVVSLSCIIIGYKA